MPCLCGVLQSHRAHLSMRANHLVRHCSVALATRVGSIELLARLFRWFRRLKSLTYESETPLEVRWGSRLGICCTACITSARYPVEIPKPPSTATWHMATMKSSSTFEKSCMPRSCKLPEILTVS